MHGHWPATILTRKNSEFWLVFRVVSHVASAVLKGVTLGSLFMNRIKPIGRRCTLAEVKATSGRLSATRMSATEGKRDCAYPEEAVLRGSWVRANGMDR